MTQVVVLALAVGCDNQLPPAPDARNVLEQIAEELPPVTEATWRDMGTLECRPTTKDMCGHGGCERQEPRVWVRWTPATRTYQRCDRNGCDTYAAHVTYGGSYANITLPERSIVAKLTGRNAFMEVVTQMDAVFIYRGRCHPATSD